MQTRCLIMLAIAVMLVLPCCASDRVATTDPLGQAPEDFSLELSILLDPAKPERDDIALQPSRYVLFADGTLHYAPDEIGGQPGRPWLPPPVRRLDRAQVAGIWSKARQLGLTDPDAAQQPTNFRLVAPPVHQALYLLRMAGHDRRWDVIRTSPIESGPDEAMRSLVRHLAQLAWADERAAEHEANAALKRQDFGPDPYARYRGANHAK